MNYGVCVCVCVCVFVRARSLSLFTVHGVYSSQGAAGPFDFSFAPANYTGSGVNPSSRYVVPRLGPWREGDIGGDSFLNWGIGEVDTLTSRQALVVVMCTPPPVRLWSLEVGCLFIH